MMFGHGGGWPFWEVALLWVGMIAFVGVLVWAVYALVVSATRKPGRDRGPQPGSALGSSVSAWPGVRSTPRSTVGCGT